MQILFGQDPANEIYKNLLIQSNIKPKFCIIQVGDDVASNVYIKYKISMAQKLDFNFIYKKFDVSITLIELQEIIYKLNIDSSVNGIIIQLPLPAHLLNIVQYIAPEKDIDGLTKIQQANLYLNQDGLYPCTALGVIKLLKYYNIHLEDKKVTVLGRSNLVGKPLSILFTHNNSLTSLIHSKISKQSIMNELQTSDIICCAIGKPNFIQPEMIKEGVVLVDIGCGLYNGQIIGDIDKTCYSKASAYTPMPKGVGPMTIANLMFNIHKAYLTQFYF